MVRLPAPIDKLYTGAGRWSLEQIEAYEHAIRAEYDEALRAVLDVLDSHCITHPVSVQLEKLIEQGAVAPERAKS